METPRDLAPQRGQAGGRSVWMGDNHDIPAASKAASFVANSLAKPTFYAVAHHGVSYLPAHGQADTTDLGSTREEQQEQMRLANLPTAALDPQVIRPLAKPTLPGVAEAGEAQFALVGMVATSRLRPLARRRERTLRPPGVFIRARKPWVRLRLMLLGWYVRFTTTSEFLSRSLTPCRLRRGARMGAGSRGQISEVSQRYVFFSSSSLGNLP